ncbi:hypothetical protein ACFQ1S_03045 [Kibdelosporangium lantanae]|uniref:Uncharacterized protein n=1 Tax=Kibdelosporangium lantanae TaxID=1497396 RepID=A0ABW3M270_9PSEU
MEPLLVTLLSTAATAVVKSLASSTWTRATKAIGTLWRRVHPEKTEAVEAELTQARVALVDARETGDDQVERDLIAEWQGRLRQLPVDAAQLAEDLRWLIDQLPLSDGTTQTTENVQMRARASGHGTVYQAGRDQHITGR